MNNNNNHHQQQQIMPLNIKYLRTRFTLRFLRALKKINNHGNNNDDNDNDNDNLKVSKRYKKVKLAADTSLALAAGPGRAWARAIIRARPGSHRVQRVMGRIKRRVRSETSRAEELRRLVPAGGEDMKDMKSLLDETLDYIMCLTTQVNVMRGIVDVCSNNNST